MFRRVFNGDVNEWSKGFRTPVVSLGLSEHYGVTAGVL